MSSIYGIVYGNRETEFNPYRNDTPTKPWRWENDPMIEITEKVFKWLPSDEIVGVVSWKFCGKTGVSKAEVEKFVKHDADVYNFSRPIPTVHFMDWSDKGHKGIKGMIQRLCKEIGLDYTNDPQHIVYANQFAAKNIVYQHYIRTVIVPCLKILEGPMWGEVNRDAGYTRAIDTWRLKQLTGLEFYNYVPFILERMLNQYIYTYDVRCLDYHK